MREYLKKEIGSRLRRLRKHLGFTQQQMVDNFDIGRANYSRIEKGEIFPVATILNTLCRQFRVSLNWLISNEGQMFTVPASTFTQPGPSPDTICTGTAVTFNDSVSAQEAEEMNQLIFYMETVPMVKHAMLSHFLEYKAKNRDAIRDELESHAGLRGRSTK